MFKCSISGCDSDRIQSHEQGTARLITCGKGHFVATDYSKELKELTQAIKDAGTNVYSVSENLSSVIAGVTTAIKNEGSTFRKEIKDELKKYAPVKK
jgi:hypothetical protein